MSVADRRSAAPERRTPSSSADHRWVVLVVGVVLFGGVVVLLPTEARNDRNADPVGVTIGAAEARSVVEEFVGLLNGGDVDAAFGRLDGLRARPEAIQGLSTGLPLDFRQELTHATWNAALGGHRVIESCSIEPWIHLVNGVRRHEDALVLNCAGTFTNSLFSAAGFADMPLGVTVAVDADRQIQLYQEGVVDASDARGYLEFRRWLRREHPEEVGRVFTPGGTPRPTADSAMLVLLRSAAYSADRLLTSSGVERGPDPLPVGGRIVPSAP